MQEIPFARVVAYRTFKANRMYVLFLNPFFLIRPPSPVQHWVEIYYKNYKGKNRVLRKDISVYKNYHELLKNLDNYLLKK
jgi:hypothetical protein